MSLAAQYLYETEIKKIQANKMATSKPKKVISQDQLRRLMREKQYSANAVAQKIEHPLAK